jgi:hypothetical protein
MATSAPWVLSHGGRVVQVHVPSESEGLLGISSADGTPRMGGCSIGTRWGAGGTQKRATSQTAPFVWTLDQASGVEADMSVAPQVRAFRRSASPSMKRLHAGSAAQQAGDARQLS